MRFHILVNPFVPSCGSGKYNCDAFNIYARRLAIMLSSDHTVFFYGTAEDTFDPCHRINHVQIVKEEEYKDLSVNRGVYLCHTDRDEIKTKKSEISKKYNLGSTICVEQNGQYGDFVLYCYTHNTDLQANTNFIHVAPCHMGGTYIYAPYTIFCSSVWAHWMLAKLHMTTGYYPDIESWGIAPPIFDKKEFLYSADKNSDVLYLARIQACKGILTFIQLAKLFPTRNFLIVGDIIDAPDGSVAPNDQIYIQDTNQLVSITKNVKILGYQNTEQRKKLLSQVSCLVQASPYPEPFGFNIVEAYLSGTPVITTDFGTFTETVLEGITGFRCRTEEEFCVALKSLDTINPIRCYQEGMKYMARCHKAQYEKLFSMFANHWRLKQPQNK